MKIPNNFKGGVTCLALNLCPDHENHWNKQNQNENQYDSKMHYNNNIESRKYYIEQ